MSDTHTEPAPEVEGDRIHSISDLAEKVDKLFDMLKPGTDGEAAGSETEPAERDVKAEVRAELAALKAAEDRKKARDAEKAANEERLARLEKVTEKQPREYKKVTHWLGWAGDEDK